VSVVNPMLDLTRDAVHRQVAEHTRGVLVDRFHARGLERQLRECVDVEEVR